MSTQQSNFHTQAEKFFSNHVQAHAVELWQSGENDHMKYTTEDGTNQVPKGVLPFDHDYAGMPVFQSDVQEAWDVVRVKTPEDGGTLVLKTEGSHSVMSFMPAGFRDAPTPNKINPFRLDIGDPNRNSPQKCASSLCHIVTTPVNIRRYNVISSHSSDVDLLKEMDRVGRQACLQLRDAPDSVVGSLRWHLKQDSTITLKNGDVVSTKLIASDFVDPTVFTKAQQEGIAAINHLFEESMQTTFHVGESASVGYLHSHTRPTCFDTVARQAMDEQAEASGYMKENTLDECIEYITSDHLQKLRADHDEVVQSWLPSATCELQVTPSSDDDDSEDDGNTLTRQSTMSRQSSVNHRSSGGLARQPSHR